MRIWELQKGHIPALFDHREASGMRENPVRSGRAPYARVVTLFYQTAWCHLAAEAFDTRSRDAAAHRQRTPFLAGASKVKLATLMMKGPPGGGGTPPVEEVDRRKDGRRVVHLSIVQWLPV